MKKLHFTHQVNFEEITIAKQTKIKLFQQILLREKTYTADIA